MILSGQKLGDTMDNGRKKKMKTIMVTGNKGEYKVLVNYIQRGVAVHSPALANKQAREIAKTESHDQLILAEEA